MVAPARRVRVSGVSVIQIILSLAAAIFGPPDAPPNKDDQPKGARPASHYFCCGTVSSAGAGSGYDCRKTDEADAQLCKRQLCCAGGYVVDESITTCTAAKRNHPAPSRFCCASTGIDDDGHNIGEGCRRSDDCQARALSCIGSWTVVDDLVTCL